MVDKSNDASEDFDTLLQIDEMTKMPFLRRDNDKSSDYDTLWFRLFEGIIGGLVFGTILALLGGV